MINFKKTALSKFAIVSLAVFLASCASQEDVVYFQGVGDYETKVSENTHSQTFKVDDLVGINVSTLDPKRACPSTS